MLEQAAAVLIALSTLFAPQFRREALALDQVRALAGAAVAAPGADRLATHGSSAVNSRVIVHRAGRRLSDGRVRTRGGIINTAREVRREPRRRSDRRGLGGTFPTACTTRDGDSRGGLFVFKRRGHCGGIEGGGGGHALPARHPVVRIGGTQRDGMGMISYPSLAD